MKQFLSTIVLLLALAFGSEKTLAATPLISVTSPAYCSDIKGDTTIDISAPGFKTVTVKCWQQGDGYGKEGIVGKVELDDKGVGSIVFPADNYPHGPVTVKIMGDAKGNKDNCYLQLYNKGGVSWNEGLPKDPPAAEGMKLIFSDDFDGPLSISSTDTKAKYYDHKVPDGSQDFSSIPFAGYDSPYNPFSQVDTYLRIRADSHKNSAGLISSVKNDGSGVVATAPCYFECRFIGPNAPGSWPAFWLLTNYMAPDLIGKPNTPCDELDIIEAVGGEGPTHPIDRSPGSFDLFQITPHCWTQGKEGEALAAQAYKDIKNPAAMSRIGIPSSWFDTFHTYGCKITETETIYYVDNKEMGHHKTLPLSKKSPFFFLINLATGGGWPVDLSRYDGKIDMYVDFVRVYQGEP